MINYSTYSYRVKKIPSLAYAAANNNLHHDYTWLFLPGGPGLGAEYLEPFCTQLSLPGTCLLADYPKDGNNNRGTLDFQYWQEGLIDLLTQCANPILVAHSFAGMFILNTPEFAPYLSGLVLMNTTTKNSFFEHVAAMQQQYQLPDLIPAAAQYHLAPSDKTYREFWTTYQYYCFTHDELIAGQKMIPLLAFNNESYHYAVENFYPHYQCRWVPNTPTLTISSTLDYICPPTIFTADPRFQQPHIINKIIPQAGHCPWLSQLPSLQECFDEFIKNRLSN